MTEEESFSIKRAMDFRPNRLFKDFMIGLRLCLIICFLGASVLGVLWLKEKLIPRDKPTPDVTTVSDGGTANIDKSQKTVNQTNMPLSTIFSFGSTGKVNSKD
jgi:hypothetical protein